MKTIKRLPTGVGPLDNVIGGFHYGNLVTFAGRPCMRTEYFVYTLMSYWLNDESVDEEVVFFSLRTRKEMVMHRMTMQVGEDKLAAMKWTAEYHLKGVELSILCDKIRMYALKDGKRVFIIDNFNFIEASVYHDFRHSRQVIARELCKLAHELDVIIIVDAMLFSYYIEEREGIEGKQPNLSDLGYQGMSGDLDVFSDMVLGFWAPEKYHIYQNERGEDLRGKIQIEVLKNVNDDNSEGRRIYLDVNRETLCIENPMKQRESNPFNSNADGPF